jgi:hypothetical protein
MAWTFTDDVTAYDAAAGGLLSSEPERHTVLLSVLATLMNRGLTAFGPAAALLGWWSDGAVVTAAGFRRRRTRCSRRFWMAARPVSSRKR